ncbi:hypothetical protein [Nocardia terpenica]|nr:hypothetical protein [Nocardia terpenica]NQE89542.1 hypothetical protein [Nocardia terpenica]
MMPGSEYPRPGLVRSMLVGMAGNRARVVPDEPADTSMYLWGCGATGEHNINDLRTRRVTSPEAVLDMADRFEEELPNLWGYGLSIFASGSEFADTANMPPDAVRAAPGGRRTFRIRDLVCGAVVFDARGMTRGVVICPPDPSLIEWDYDTLAPEPRQWLLRRFFDGAISASVWAAALSLEPIINADILSQLTPSTSAHRYWRKQQLPAEHE